MEDLVISGYIVTNVLFYFLGIATSFLLMYFLYKLGTRKDDSS